MEHNTGGILQSIVVDNPEFFKKFSNLTEADSIMKFIEFPDANNKSIIRIKDTEEKLTLGIINQLKENFEIID